jgi:hypothetical protein
MLFVGVAIVCNPLQKLSALTYPGFTLEYLQLREGRVSVSAYSALPPYVCIRYVCITEEQ